MRVGKPFMHLLRDIALGMLRTCTLDITVHDRYRKPLGRIRVSDTGTRLQTPKRKGARRARLTNED